MQEQLISFETAKLAKEKGFDTIDCTGYYHINSGYTKGFAFCYSDVNTQDEEVILAPTQSLLQRWLREVHKVHVSVDIDISDEWYFSMYDLNSKRNSEIPTVFSHHLAYEEALEEGFKQALLLIKKEN